MISDTRSQRSRLQFTTRSILWAMLAVSVPFEFARWLRIEWLPETLVVLGTATVLLLRRETSERCVLYGALCGAIGFSAGTLIVALIHPARYATLLGELIFIPVPLVGAVYGGFLGVIVWICILLVRRVSGNAGWCERITPALVLKVALVLLALVAVALELACRSPRAPWRTRTLTGHKGNVNSIAFHPREIILASAGADGTVRLWDPVEGVQLAVLKGHAGGANTVAFSPWGTRLASGGADGAITLWDVTSGEALQTLTGHADQVTCLAFSPDGHCLASGSGSIWPAKGEVKLWNLATGKEVASLDWRGEISAAAFSTDGETLAVADGGPTIKLLDARSLSEVRTLTRHQDGVQAVVFSPDGRYLATAGGRGDRPAEVFLWDADDWTPVRRIHDPSYLALSLAFSPDGSALAIGSRETRVRLWNVESGKKNMTLRGHTYEAEALAFSPDGNMLAAAGPDGTITIWTLD